MADSDCGIAKYEENSCRNHFDAPSASAIASIRAYGLDSAPGPLPDGVRPLWQANYLLAGEWTPADAGGIRIEAPFLITVDWDELAY